VAAISVATISKQQCKVEEQLNDGTVLVLDYPKLETRA
jgi:hypothetical protein